MKRWWMVVLAAVTFNAWAQVEVKEAWARATVPQQKATGAFMQITAAQATRLVEVKSSVAGVAEVHEMSMKDNLMQMRPVKALDLPAGKMVELKPGGYHVMLLDLKQPIKDGDDVPLTLVLEGADGKRTTVDVKAKARGMQPMQGHGAHKMQH